MEGGSQGSSAQSFDLLDNALGMSSSGPPDGMVMVPLVVTGRRREDAGGQRDDTSPRRAVGVSPSGDDDDDDEDDSDSAMLTPTPEPRATPITTRSATPPPLLLHDGLFMTPPKATVHYPHLLEPITERASVATLRSSHSTLRQQPRSLPLVVRLSSPTRSFPSPLLSASASSLSLSTARERLREGSPPPARAPTPLTHPIFETTQATTPGHLQASPPGPRDRFLLTATETPAERSLRMHMMNYPRDVAMHGPEHRTEAQLRAARLKVAAGSTPDGHYRPWNMRARRRLQQEQAVSEEKESVGEGTGTGTGTAAAAAAAAGLGMKVRMRINRRKGNAGRNTRMGKEIGGKAGTFAKKEKLGGKARVGVGKKRKGRRWDRFWGKMSWVCCGV